MQSRIESLYEAVHNTWIGFIISMLVQQFIVTPLAAAMQGCHLSVAFNVVATIIFTVISVARIYLIRRWNVYKYRSGVRSLWDFFKRFGAKGSL